MAQFSVSRLACMWRVSRTIIRKAVNSGLPSEEEHSSGVGSKLARLSTRTTNRVEASCCQASVLPHPPWSLPCPRLSNLCKRVVFIPVRPVNKEGKGQRELVEQLFLRLNPRPVSWERSRGRRRLCLFATNESEQDQDSWVGAWGQLDEESLSKKILVKNRKLKIDVTNLQNISWKSVPVHSTSPEINFELFQSPRNRGVNLSSSNKVFRF